MLTSPFTECAAIEQLVVANWYRPDGDANEQFQNLLTVDYIYIYIYIDREIPQERKAY